MGTHIAMSAHGAEVTAAYRTLEGAYHDVQAAQIHLRSVHAGSMHARLRGQDQFRQELRRLASRLERATSAYQNAVSAYVRAASAVPSDDGPSPAAPFHHGSPEHGPHLHP